MKTMKFYHIFALVLTLALLPSCNKFDYDTPDVNHDIYSSDQEATGCTTTLGTLKELYKNVIADESNRNRWVEVTEDVIFDGYVCANDVSGNLYQSIYVRKGDDCISVGINDNSLWCTYPVGTHVKVNLKGLYIGSYGNLAKIGTPYTTSGGNKRLGGMPKFKAAQSIEIIGFDETVYEVKPIEIDRAWLDQHNNNDDMHKWCPMLVMVNDAEIHGFNKRKVYAVYDDRDAGNGVNDTIYVGGKKFILRQSALADFSSKTIPTGTLQVTAVLTRYSNTWQFTLREERDAVPQIHIDPVTPDPDDGDDEDEEPDPTPGSNGNGTIESPYNVAETQSVYENAGGNATKAYVTGYVVGYVNGQGFNAESAIFGMPESQETEILIADSPEENDYTKCVPVQLPKGEFRDGLDIYSNQVIFGQQVLIYGSIEKYFGVCGIKAPTYAAWGETVIGTATAKKR